MSEFFRRLRYLLRRGRAERELASDMAFHREMAEREGRTDFGNGMRLQEEAREAWGWMWFERLLQDLRYAARILRRSPGFTFTAVAMLAIGIGVNVAAFGFFNLLLFQPMAIREPGTLVRFHRKSPQNFSYALPYPEMDFFRQYSKTLSAVIAINGGGASVVGESKPVRVEFVTENLFSELGAPVLLGRSIAPGIDAGLGAEPVVVLTEAFWKRHYGGDPAVVGKILRLNDRPATIIGVVPMRFNGLRMGPELSVWMPLSQEQRFIEGSKLFTDYSVESTGVRMWGRIRPGLTAAAAESELRTLTAQLRKSHPEDIWENEGLASEPGGYAKSLMIEGRRGSGSDEEGELYPVVGMVTALSLLILVVACSNLGSLLLARAVAREREISIRISVGAGRARLVRQLFTESLLLAMMGAAAGLGMGWAVLRTLIIFADAPAWMNATPDWRVAGFAAGVGLASAVLFGLTPSLQMARQRHRATLLRQFFVGGQVAASCVLLIVAGLLVRALTHAVTTSPGFEYELVASLDPALSAHGYTPANARIYFQQLEQKVRGVAGVKSVSSAILAPLGHGTIGLGVTLNNRQVTIHINDVAPEYFSTMSIPLLRGRDFRAGEQKVIIVSRTFAQLAWPGQEALGHHFDRDGIAYNVVGVAADAKFVDPADGDAVEGYFPLEESDLPRLLLLVRTRGNPEGVVPFLASLARGVDPKIFPEVELMKESFRRAVEGTSKSAVVVTVLGVAANLLACLGIVGLVAYAVSQRTKEIGLRMALGAQPGQILKIVLLQFARPVGIGLVLGVAGGGALSQILRRQLFGISNLDPVAYGLAIGLFLVTAALASLWPARQALRVDPMAALRCE